MKIRFLLAFVFTQILNPTFGVAGEEIYFDYEQIRANSEAGVRREIRNEKMKSASIYGLSGLSLFGGACAVYAGVKCRLVKSPDKLSLEGNASDSSDKDRNDKQNKDSEENSFKTHFTVAAGASGAFVGFGMGREISREAGNVIRDTQREIVTVFAGGGEFDDWFEYRIARHIQTHLYNNNLIDDATNSYIENNLKHLHFILNSPSKKETYNQIKIKNTLEGLRCIFKLPKNIKRLRASRSLKNRLDDLIRSYPREFRKDIEKTVLEIVDNSRHENDFTPRKIIPFFIGSPGTGKTYLANELAELLDLPFVEISLAEVDEPTKVFGSDEDSFREGAPLQNFQSLSLFSRAILTAKNSDGQNYKNVIILIDEIDRLLNAPRMGNHGIGVIQNIMLRLLDPDRATIKLLDLDLEVDISHCIFILTGNNGFNDEALRDRVREFHFPAFSEDKKLSIAIDKMNGIAEARNLSLSEADFDRLSEFCINDDSDGIRPTLAEIDSIISNLIRTNTNWEEE